jgi:hypothetical protein
MHRLLGTISLLATLALPFGAVATATDEQTFDKLIGKVAPNATDLFEKFKPRFACACLTTPSPPGVVMRDSGGLVRCGSPGFSSDGKVIVFSFCSGEFEVLGR